MVAKGVEFHFHAGKIELVECGYEASEGGFRAVFNLLMGEEAVDAGCTFCDEFDYLIGGFSFITEDCLYDSVVEIIVAVLVAQGFVVVGAVGVSYLVGIPVICHRNTYEHYPAE